MAMLVTGNPDLYSLEGVRRGGYKSFDEQVDDFISSWHEQVKPTDQVYVIGSLAASHMYYTALDKIKELPGEKHLITGPNDPICPDSKKGWHYDERIHSVFPHTATHLRRRLHGEDAIMSFYGPQDDDVWWAPRPLRQGAYYLTAWNSLAEEEEPITDGELSVSWGTWGRFLDWDDIKEEVVDHATYSPA